MVVNIGKLIAGERAAVVDDIWQVVRATRSANPAAIVKVILETAALSEAQIILGCRCTAEAQAEFVKTSTGFSTGGATAADIALMRKTVGPEMGVKASGGVRTREQALAMIEAGATRIGCSSTKTIMG